MFKIKEFTQLEIDEIEETFEEWDEEGNEFWTEEEIESNLTPYVEKYLKYYPFAKRQSERMWLVIKLKDFELHATDWTEKRIKENKDKKFLDFDDEVGERICLEECEKHDSKWINEKLKERTQESFRIELQERLTLEECEKHRSDFIDGRLESMTFESFEEELSARMTLELCEHHNSELVNEEIMKLWKLGRLKDLEDELQKRIHLVEYEHKMDTKVEKVYTDDEMKDKKYLDEIEEISWFRKKLNEVGRGFCLAKWNQVTVLLQTGMTHSCHHPTPHKIPLSELEANPTALHNTEFKKKQRTQMLNGERPPECEYCWNVEDSNKDAFSDRHFKSSEEWAFPDFDKTKKMDGSENINPPYVEISFSNKCNMRCMYCDVKSSSRWQSEINRHGPYPTSGMFNNTDWMEEGDMMPIRYDEPNPYIDAFMKWWPDLFKDLHTFRITGGEPLLHKETFYILDYIIEHHEENPNLVMSINTNCSVPEDVFDEFIEKVKIITDGNMVKNFGIYTSIEADDEQAEYIRDGMDSKRFWNHVDKFLTECKKPDITIMATYNALSVISYDKVIRKVFDLKQKHYNGERYRHYAILLDTSYLRYPEFFQVRILPTNFIDKMEKTYQMIKDLSDEKFVHIRNHGHTGYYEIEIEKVRRLIDWMKAPIEDVSWLVRQRKDFVKMIREFDIRRDKSFLETFPEMETFYRACEGLL